MQTLKVSKFLSTQLNPDFNLIDTIEIEDTSFDSGGFGAIYKCLSINNKTVNSEQVIKILNREEEKGYETIKRLQTKIIQKNIDLRSKKEIELQIYPVFKALPQFSFEGTLDGKTVMGYSANFLPKTEYISWANVGQDELKIYIKSNLYKNVFCYHLAKGFEILKSLNYIHADINPQNIFVNLKTGELVIIDYDSGCIKESKDDKPSTIGKDVDGEWYSPEIQKARENNSTEVKVDFDTDLWSVTVGIHFLLFGVAPLFFLIGNGATFSINNDYYQAQYKWPEIKYNYEDFVKGQERFHKNYKGKFDKLNPDIRYCLSETFNAGYLQPFARTPYHKWTEVLVKPQNLPKISFESNKASVLGKSTIVVKWEVKNAVKVLLGSEEVQPKGFKQFEIDQETVFNLSAQSIFGKINKEVRIEFSPLPTINIIPSSDKIRRGEKVKFKWTGTYLNNVMMYDSKGTLLADVIKGNEFSTPKLTTDSEFTFKAIGKYGGEITKTFSIKVYHPTRIISFSADRQVMVESQPVVFSWEVENAQEVFLNGQDVTKERKIVLYPDKKMQYILTAKNTFFEDTRSIYMNVIALPKAPIQLAKVDIPLIGLAPPQYSSIVKQVAALKSDLEVLEKSTLRGKIKSWIFQAVGKLKLNKKQNDKPLIEFLKLLRPEHLTNLIGGKTKLSNPNFSFKISDFAITKMISEIVAEELRNNQSKK